MTERIQTTLVCGHFRGDHEADVRIAIEVQPGETVEALASRLLGRCVDHVELRLIADGDDVAALTGNGPVG